MIGSCLIGILLVTSGCSEYLSSSPGNLSEMSVRQTSLDFYTEEQPPLNYVDQKGDVSGSSTTIVREIMKRQNINAPIHLVSWARGYDKVLTTPGTAIFSTSLTDERKPLFKWVGPIATVEYSFFGRDDFSIPVTSMEDVRNAGVIAVVGNTGRHQTLKSNAIDNLLLCEDDTACVEAVLSGKAALWFGTKDMYSQTAKRLSSEMNRIIEIWPYMSKGLYIAFNPSIPDSEIENWQDTLNKMKDDGTYEKIVERFMPYICSWVKCTP